MLTTVRRMCLAIGMFLPLVACSAAQQPTTVLIGAYTHHPKLSAEDQKKVGLGGPDVIFWKGLGFVVSTQDDVYIVTAAHVLELVGEALGHIEAEEKSLVVALPGHLLEALGTMVVAVDHKHDLALLKIHQTKEPMTASALCQRQWPDGTRVNVAGLDKNNAIRLVSGLLWEHWTMPQPDTFEKDRTGSHPLVVPGHEDVGFIDLAVHPGYSGGPVYLPRTGAVVGMTLLTFGKEETPVAGFTKSKRLAQFLKENGVQFRDSCEK